MEAGLVYPARLFESVTPFMQLWANMHIKYGLFCENSNNILM
jgi:hypothetical protein